ncbi:polysaccharide export protein [Halioglobus maricola]|uniref:Polysaccharide export protein n=1 Tax=Halioglobus maricola TaxID=2601894 RepID=A0A5P9NGE1_9GAMM|nr:polysaccharide biosynthesis/export family protein [Halioglobus maricola]QFU74625.1 polysaccharide export protein [Halioglobus maricola]
MGCSRFILAFLLFCTLAACSSSGVKSSGVDGPAKVVGDNTVESMPDLPDAPDTMGAVSYQPENEYRLGPTDEVAIEVFLVEELSGIYVVDTRGEISMPLLANVKVSGKTIPEVEVLLETLYGHSYLQNPQVSVTVVEYASQQVTVLGSIKQPGIYPLKKRTTLLQVMAMAGGVTRIADQEEIVLFRQDQDGAVYGYLVQLEQIKSGIKKDPIVLANDRIVVPESGTATFMKSFSLGVPGFGGYRQY